jgi:hypothetical protein
MTDKIPPDVRAYLDDVARHLRGRNVGEPISVAWARYEVWTRYLLKACRRPPRVPLPRGRPPHPKRKDIILRLLRAELSGKRGALERALEKECDDHAINTRTLEGWIRWPPSRELIEAMVQILGERNPPAKPWLTKKYHKDSEGFGMN